MAKRIKKVNDEQLIDWKAVGQRVSNLPWFVWAVVLLVIAGFVFYFVGVFVSDKISTMEYKDLTFKKEMYGDVMMYHYFYSFVNKKGEVIRYNVYLQNDPRTNPATYEGEMKLNSHNVYLSIDTPGLLGQQNSMLAVGKMGEFLKSNDFNVTVAVPELGSANLNNVTVANCETNPDDEVILIRAGNQTKVTHEGNCFIVESKNGQVLESVERFIVELIAQAKVTSAQAGYTVNRSK